MQGNRDGSWSLNASVNGGSGNGGYLPPPSRVFSSFNIQQQRNRYNFQNQHNNLNFRQCHPPPEIPSFLPLQFGSAANLFLPIHDQNSGYLINGTSENSSSKSTHNVQVMRIDKAVDKTRKSLVASGESVSSTKVWQLVSAQLHPDSFGLQIQDVPSFRQLMAIEGNINAFIHCFIGARRIVTLHDLEVAICRNEHVHCFNDLELGPLLQHPLVLLYFPSISGCTGTVQITSEEIISLLDSYLNIYDMDDIKVDEFLNFVAEEKSVASKEKLGVRIQSLGMYVSFIRDIKRREGESLKILLTELHQKYHIPSSKKQRQDKADVYDKDLRRKDYCGKHTRFKSSSSDDYGGGDCEVENVNNSDLFGCSPYPSVSEEVKKHGSSKKKRKAESCNHEKSDLSKLRRRGPSKLCKGDVKQEAPKSADDSDAKQVFGVNDADITRSEGDLRLFLSTWKDACKELSMTKKEIVREALEEHIPTEVTDTTKLVAGYDNYSGTISRANKPNPSHPMPTKSTSMSENLAHEWNHSASNDFNTRDHFHTSTSWAAAQTLQTGKKGEEIAYRYFAAKHGKEAMVRWVNEQSETGLPYDLIVENRGGKKEYIEVKTTVSTGKDYFNLTVKEWEFANEKGESYVIAHVLLGNSNAILTQHRNLVKLCHEGHLRLLILMANQRNAVNVAF